MQSLKMNIIDILKQLNDASTEAEYLDTIVELEAIDTTESWLRSYYIALCQILISLDLRNADKKDEYINQAEKQIRQLELNHKHNDEILVLKAFWLQAKIMVSVLTRGPLYIKDVDKYLEQAQGINPQNPRVYFLLGQAMLNKPSFIGGGKKGAKPYLIKAKSLFERAKAKKEGYPDWGEKQTDELLAIL